MIKLKEILLLGSVSGIGKGYINGKYWNILKESIDVDDLISKMEVSSNISRKILEMAKQDAEEKYNYIINSDIHVITVFDEDYPKKLLDMGNKKPPILYIKGNVEALKKDNIAVIGTRKPSKNSEIFEENMVKSLLDSSDRVVVSGLALGCDKIAHQTTVNQNMITIAVLPSGVNVIKPAKHKKLAEEIINTGGCLVSEYDPDAKPYKGMYVDRDAIVAALCDAIFVVECGVKSGTMHTVNFANDFKRPIYTYLPDQRSEGSYDGNEFILSEFKNSIKVRDIKEFIGDLETVKVKKQTKSIQQTLDF